MIVKCGNLEPTKATLKDRGNFKNTIHTRENFKGLTFETMHFEFTHFTDNKPARGYSVVQKFEISIDNKNGN